MSNFHSVAARMLGEAAEILHASHNSHSQMITEARWRENKPNESVRVFEAEWDGRGAFPSDSSLIRNVGECPERLKDKIRNHYKKVQAAITKGEHFDHYFADYEKYSDVYAMAVANGVGIVFPKHQKGNLDLNSLTTVPEGFKLPETVSGYLDLNSLTTVPEGFKLPETVSGYLYLNSLTTVPEGFKLPETVSGGLYLRSLTTVPEGFKLPETVSGGLYLNSLTTVPEGFKLPETVSGYLYLNSDMRTILLARPRNGKKKK
jgi:hypothetical protein